MKRFIRAARTLVLEENGSEITEYAVVLGLVSVVTITLIYNFGVKVVARWSSVNSSM